MCGKDDFATRDMRPLDICFPLSPSSLPSLDTITPRGWSLRRNAVRMRVPGTLSRNEERGRLGTIPQNDMECRSDASGT
jgi:hypothetical protein